MSPIPLLAGLTFCLASLNAYAVALFFDPASATAELGNQVAVDVAIEDLGDFASPSLSTLDIDVLFDDTLLSVVGVAFGSELDQGGFGSIQGDFSFPGGHNAFEVSLEDAVDLVANQPASFVLFTLTFDTLAVGTSPLDLIIQDLADEQVPSNFISADTSSGSITVTLPTPTVPEPGVLALVVLGLLTQGVARRRIARQ